MLFLKSYSTVRSIKKLPRSRPAIQFKLKYGTGSDISNANHMFPNPVVSFTYPQTLRMLWILQVRTYTHFESLFEGPMFSRPQ